MKKCPFCGKHVNPTPTYDEEDKMYQCVCWNCNAAAPKALRSDEARRLWNRRVS